MGWLLAWGVAIFICGLLGSHVAATKDRPAGEGAVFGSLLGPLGVLIVALLPDGEAAPAPRWSSPIDPDEVDDVDVDTWDVHNIMGLALPIKSRR